MLRFHRRALAKESRAARSGLYRTSGREQIVESGDSMSRAERRAEERRISKAEKRARAKGGQPREGIWVEGWHGRGSGLGCHGRLWRAYAVVSSGKSLAWATT